MSLNPCYPPIRAHEGDDENRLVLIGARRNRYVIALNILLLMYTDKKMAVCWFYKSKLSRQPLQIVLKI